MTIKKIQMQKRIQQLFNYVKQTDQAHIPRLEAFSKFALKHNLKCETVRNLYYSAVKQYKMQEIFNIEKCKHFNASELKTIMTQLVSEINRTKSVRQACYNLSNGNAKLMLRLQNKYRSISKNTPQYLIELGLNYKNITTKNTTPPKVNKSSQKTKINIQKSLENVNNFILKNQQTTSKISDIPAKNDKIVANICNIPIKNEKMNIFCTNKNNCAKNIKSNNNFYSQNVEICENNLSQMPPNKPEAKILKMPSTPKLTDTDINNLFMGLVKMVKRNAIESAPQNLRDECAQISSSLKETLVQLNINTRRLEVVKCENQSLKQKLNESQKLLKQTRSEYAQLINKIDKTGHIEELKNFLKLYKSHKFETNLN